jgi:hypothetical protein
VAHFRISDNPLTIAESATREITSGCAVIQELKRQRLIIVGEEKVLTLFDRGVDSSILGSVPASVVGILAEGARL